SATNDLWGAVAGDITGGERRAGGAARVVEGHRKIDNVPRSVDPATVDHEHRVRACGVRADETLCGIERAVPIDVGIDHDDVDGARTRGAGAAHAGRGDAAGAVVDPKGLPRVASVEVLEPKRVVLRS